MKTLRILTNLKGTQLVLMLVFAVAIDSAHADFIFGKPENLGPGINTSYSEGLACITPDGLSLYFTSNRPGGSGAHDLYIATRASSGDNWSQPTNLGATVNSYRDEFFSWISTDGLTLYFDSTRPGGRGARDLWGTTRPSLDTPWTSPVNLGSAMNSSSDDVSPCFSADGLTLIFASSRPGGRGSYDLYICTRTSVNAAWSAPVNLGAPINSAHLDVAPCLSSDGLILFFHSIRPTGFGSYDLYYSRRQTLDAPWSTPVHLPATVNSSYVELGPSLSADGRVLYFCENPNNAARPDGYGSSDIWQVEIRPVVDFDGNRKVDFKDFSKLVQYWQQSELSCDIGPTPFGDRTVDVQDVSVFTEYWLEDARLIAHWKLDEAEGTVAFDSVHDKDGTVRGDPAWQPNAGKADGALQFDGTDDYVSAGFPLGPADLSLSVFAWVKGGAPGQVIICQPDRRVGRTMEPGSTWLGTDASDGRLLTRLLYPLFGPLESDSVITDDQWHHVGLVYDFDDFHRRLYVDGDEVAKDTDVVAGLLSDGDLYFGAGKDLDADGFFSGLVDDIRMYNQPLSAKEIEEMAR